MAYTAQGEGPIGIGTLTALITTVLIAATIAGVLLNTGIVP